jgi:hypothetical protein
MQQFIRKNDQNIAFLNQLRVELNQFPNAIFLPVFR